jgi:ferredoxin
MAFADELREINPSRVTITATDRHGRPDLAALIADAPAGAAVYCCGPPGLLADVTRYCERRSDVALLTERFTADPAAPPIYGEHARPINVELAVTGAKIVVPADQTILEAIRDVRPDVPFSCEEGYCGTCETRVLDGVPEHRDSVLGTVEREGNTRMMICVSRAKTDHLTLDI